MQGVRLKDLTPVKFNYHTEGAGTKEGKDQGEAVCPSCMKKLSNNVIMFCESQALTKSLYDSNRFQ